MIARGRLGFAKGSRRNMRSETEECSEARGVGCAQVVLRQDGDWEFGRVNICVRRYVGR